MADLKHKIENNVTIWLLGTLLTGFLAGIGTYEGALKLMKLETISSDRLAMLKNRTDESSEYPPDAYSVPLPDYLGEAEIELLFEKIKAVYNDGQNDALYELIGPVGRAQVSKASTEQQLKYLYENLGKIEEAFFVQHQFASRIGSYKTFALNFSVKYEKAEKGLATITVIDDGSSYQVYSVMFNRL